MSYIANIDKYPVNEVAPFKFHGIPFDAVNPDESEGFMLSEVCETHLQKYREILEPIMGLVIKPSKNIQCGVYGCEDKASWYIEFPYDSKKATVKEEKYVYIVRSFQRIKSESMQDIYGVFEDKDDAIACFNKVLASEKEGGYFSEEDCSPFRNDDFNYMGEHHIFNDNDDSDWWECEICTIPLNHSFA